MRDLDPRERRAALRRTPVSGARAHSLRATMSVPEVILWSALRRAKLGGLRFRRQHPLGPYNADFYCHEALLVVEVDGRVHRYKRKEDGERDAWMTERGLRVLRFRARDIGPRLSDVLDTIRRVGCERRHVMLARRGAPTGLEDSATSPAGAGEEG